jgi:hypothetical protein
VPDLVLRPSEQAALRSLLSAEPVPGRPVPPIGVLETIERLVPCDGSSTSTCGHGSRDSPDRTQRRAD